MSMKTWRLFLLAAAMLLSTSWIFAQDITGSIVGTVKDSTGAAIAGATVKIMIPTQGSRLIRTVTTSDEGTFSAPNIPTNIYTVSVEAPNFKKIVQTDIRVDVGQRRPVEITLEAGNISETVTVQADQVAVDATTSASSTSISGDQARELSVNNRNWIQFVTLAPGVSNNLPDLVPVGSFSPDGSAAIAAIAVNGARQSQNTFTVDGADITDRGSNITLQAFPSIDSIGELKVLRSLYPAESGRSGGGQINIVTRSGTDKFHGAMFEFLRNERLNANSYLNNRSAPLGREGDDCKPPNTQTSAACIQNGKAKRPPFRYNNYGFTIGGPVYFFNFGENDDPGFFRRYRKTYFFFSEEQRKDRRYSNLSGSVPSANLRNGIFSFPICLSGTITGAVRTCPTILPAGTPLSAVSINSASMSYLTNIFRNEPLPTSGFTTFAPAVSTFDFKQEILKIDTSLTKNLTSYYRYQRDKIPSVAPNSVFNTPCNVANVCPGVTDSPGRTHTFQVTWVATPNLIAEFRYTHAFGAINVDTGGLMSAANSSISVNKPYVVDDDRIPHLALTNLSTLQAFGPYRNFSNKNDWGGSITLLEGNHTIKFGGNYSRYRKNEDNGLGGTGQGSFTAFFNTTAASPTRGTVCVDATNTAIVCPTGNQTTEQNFANFLLGNNVTFTQTKYRLTADFRQQNFEAFVQDEYRLKRNVTLYAGVRYSFFGAPWAANGLLSNFVPELYNRASAPQVDFAGNRVSGSGNFCNGIIVNSQNYTTGPASYQCTPRSSPFGKYIYESPNKNFAPRVGLAWDLSGKSSTVLRMGYGIYHEQTLLGNIETHLGSNPPYQETITFSGGSVSQPIPVGVIPAVTSALGIPGLIRGVDTDFKTPYMQHWSLDIQHMFSSKSIVQVGYYGSKGTHLIGIADINLLPSGSALDKTCQRTATTSGACQLKDASGNPLPIITTADSLILDQIRPYKGWRGIAMVQPRYNSNYHSLQVSATQRFSGASQAQLAYTWSKNLTDNQSDRSSAPQNTYDILSERGRATLDRRHILTINYIYEIPFFSKQHGFTGKLLGGWQVSGIITGQSGLPFTPTFGSFDPAGNGFINTSSPAGGRPYVVTGQDPNTGPRTFAQWFNTAAFQSTVPTSYPAVAGNAGRGIITGPPLYRVDFTMTKNIRFTESMRLQLKGEVFNAFNHTNFTTLGLSASTPSTFGTVTGTRDPRTLQLGVKFLF